MIDSANCCQKIFVDYEIEVLISHGNCTVVETIEVVIEENQSVNS